MQPVATQLQRIKQIFPVNLPVIGMIHLPALPGSPGCEIQEGFPKAWSRIEDAVMADARALADGGVDGIMIENFGDVPFFPGVNPVHVATLMTAMATKVRQKAHKPIGINVLRNDGVSALAIALASEAQFIRVNVLSGARVTDQGVVQGAAHELLRYRHQIGADHIAILADVQVKHSSPLGGGTLLSQDVDDLCHRALADGVIVSGSGTGKAVDLDALKTTKIAAGRYPVFIGSGTTIGNLGEISKYAYGFIVGTTFKVGGVLDAPVDVGRVATFMAEVAVLRAKVNQ